MEEMVTVFIRTVYSQSVITPDCGANRTNVNILNHCERRYSIWKWCLNGWMFHSQDIMCDEDDISSIVIDNGSCVCKMGYAGEDIPKCRVPTVIGRPLHQVPGPKKVLSGSGVWMANTICACELRPLSAGVGWGGVGGFSLAWWWLIVYTWFRHK